MFEIKDLKASIEEKDILNGISLTIKPGEIHAIMGPNGSGKSTLAKVISGHPDFEDPEGDIQLDGKDILDLEPDQRANEGVFLAFQYPVDIPGVNNSEFLRMAYNAKQKYNNKPEIDPFDFDSLIKEKLTVLNLKEAFLSRPVNHGLSGGEKKRNEILQMLMLDPRVVVLDETDSGLDIDSLKQVSDAINHFKSENKMILIITHYQRLLNHIVPDIVHIMAEGKIIKSGDKSLALTLEDQGYDVFKEEKS